MGYEPDGDDALFKIKFSPEQEKIKYSIGKRFSIILFYGILIFFVIVVIGVLTLK